MPAPSSAPAPARSRTTQAVGSRYKWIALSNTTLGVLMVTVNSSIVLIALPNIFRGIGINPLQPGNTTILLWMMMGFMVVTAVLVVSFGRLGDMFGRVRMFNMGFAIFSLFSILLSVSWLQGEAAGWYLIIMRILQGIGGAMLFANSSAILTDAFPANQRGMALGLNQVAGIAGSFIGLVLGGVLGPVELAPGVPRLRAVRRHGHRLVLPQAQGTRRAQARQARPRRATSRSRPA